METQLVRLDAPYNLICNKDAKFGLHIATLIEISEASDSKTLPLIRSYPVVSGGNELDGAVWTDSELKDCVVVGKQNEKVTLRTIKDVMKFCFEKGYILLEALPIQLGIELYLNGMKISPTTPRYPKQAEGVFVEELIFESTGNSEYHIVSSSRESDFFFIAVFIQPNPSASGFTKSLRKRDALTIEGAIRKLKSFRKSYLLLCKDAGVKDIEFYTKNKEFQGFVDKLNGDIADGD
ncbi:MAG: hypothetical protein IKQ59_00655 [Prevotella sp.]|nr:hypothetical protein [Prevotella sp.]MBR6187463.1 hypothetical protein [Prevotella sp.]